MDDDEAGADQPEIEAALRERVEESARDSAEAERAYRDAEASHRRYVRALDALTGDKSPPRQRGNNRHQTGRPMRYAVYDALVDLGRPARWDEIAKHPSLTGWTTGSVQTSLSDLKAEGKVLPIGPRGGGKGGGRRWTPVVADTESTNSN